jgi:hypothetical protein
VLNGRPVPLSPFRLRRLRKPLSPSSLRLLRQLRRRLISSEVMRKRRR